MPPNKDDVQKARITGWLMLTAGGFMTIGAFLTKQLLFSISGLLFFLSAIAFFLKAKKAAK